MLDITPRNAPKNPIIKSPKTSNVKKPVKTPHSIAKTTVCEKNLYVHSSKIIGKKKRG